MKSVFLFACFALGLAVASGSTITPLTKLTKDELATRFASDLKQIEIERDGIRQVLDFMNSKRDLFPSESPSESRLFRREEKEVVWTTWQRFADYLAGLESVQEYHWSFHRLNGEARQDW